MDYTSTTTASHTINIPSLDPSYSDMQVALDADRVNIDNLYYMISELRGDKQRLEGRLRNIEREIIALQNLVAEFYLLKNDFNTHIQQENLCEFLTK